LKKAGVVVSRRLRQSRASPNFAERSLFKQHVQLYHNRVRHRVSEAQKIIWRVRRLGVFVKQKDLADEGLRKEMIGKLPADEGVRKDV